LNTRLRVLRWRLFLLGILGFSEVLLGLQGLSSLPDFADLLNACSDECGAQGDSQSDAESDGSLSCSLSSHVLRGGLFVNQDFHVAIEVVEGFESFVVFHDYFLS